ncbi:MAG: hypothetical protein AAB426_08740 [Myxococcota bacterium]
MQDKDAIDKLIDEVLDGTELRLVVDSYGLEENLEPAHVHVECRVHDERTGATQVIDGDGVGLVDAVFHGMVARYAGEFPSLTTIRFADFSIKADVTSGGGARSDMAAVASLTIANSEGTEYIFSDASPSITRSALASVLRGVEFFINSERAFIAVYRALNHAREANRPDSVARYTTQLTTLVQATSYSEVIEQIRKKELAGPKHG